jgi:TonB-linked SusC/RagA family outer membrane protein
MELNVYDKMLPCNKKGPFCITFKMLLIMKFTAIFLLAACLQVSAKGFSQKVTLSVKKASLEKVLREIKKQSGYDLVYDIEMLRQRGKPVDITITDVTVEQALNMIFQNQPLAYEIVGNAIISVKEKPQLKITVITAVPPPVVINGKVTDENGKPLEGVSVVIKGTSKGSTTNNKGEFSLGISENEKTSLEFSFVGYDAVAVEYIGQKNLVVKLVEANNNLGQVVVVGYGTQNKKDVSTSVASIKASEINNFPATGLDKVLTGKLAGVQVLQPGGAPGAGIAILIRGRGTITAGSDPLYVIDGVPLSDNSTEGPGFKVNPLNSINVNDIESIDILKDASASAIYGSRGSNGVVIITTKRGKKDKLVIGLNSYYGIQQVSKKIEMMDAYQYADLIYESHNNTYFDLLADRGLTGSATDDNAARKLKLGAAANNDNLAYLLPPEIFPYLNKQSGLVNTNWQDEVFTKAPMQSHTISAAGGSENIKYYISGNYLDQTGIVLNSGYKKYGGRINLDANYNKLKLGASINYNFGVYNFLPTEGRFNDVFENVISGALAASPFFPVYNTDGLYNNDQYKWLYSQANGANPVALAMLKKDKTFENKLLSNLFAEYEIFKNLKYKISFGTDISNYKRDVFRPSTLPDPVSRVTPSNPTANYRMNNITNWTVENMVSYNKIIGKHSIKAIAVFSAQKERQDASNITATGFPNDIVQTLNGATSLTSWSSTINEWSLISGLARVQYSFKNKYLLSAALRTDGSSRFGPKNKWGYFPSASIGWNISDEPFVKNLKTVSSLKVRASYGVTGNFQIGNYGYLSLLSASNYVFGTSSGSLNAGLVQSTASNPELGWEKTSAINLGLEIGLFKEQLHATIEVYNNNTKNLLLNAPVPLSTGFSTNLVNIGKVNNKGIEITLTNNLSIGRVKLLNSVNYSKNINKVLDLGGANSIITRGQGVIDFITQVGQSIGNFYTLVQTGVFKDQVAINDPKNAKVSGAKPGDFMFKDVNGDGVIDNTNDREITGNYMPKFTYGFSSQIQYSLFDLGFAAQGVQGNTIANINQRHMNSAESYANNTVDILNRWHSPTDPGNGTIARANRSQRGLNAVISTYHLSDGSYLRIRDITLGITLPQKMISKAKITGARFYITVQNLFTFTKYNSYNPEVSIDTNPLTPGIDYGSYPLAKSVFFGLNLTF